MIRFFDFVFSFVTIITFFPIGLILSIIIKIESKGGVFYKQIRVGRNGKDFKIWKFRTMYVDSDKKGLLTVGAKDTRITRIGYFLRKYKIDEFPQFINVLIGEMSIVGPRPEVRKYVNLYNNEQIKILSVRPGITDSASIKYKNEASILSKQSNPEEYYINTILPEKINLSIENINNISLVKYFSVMYRTVFSYLFCIYPCVENVPFI
jgi:lipopolysaccharide/colanic/teichoic acid biosynthesis glycosyltransferase